MKLGSLLALIGAVMVLVGGMILPWQTFELAGISALAYQIPPAGQVVVGLAAIIALTSLLGLVTRRRKQFATASLIMSVFLIGWVVMANVLRGSDMIFDLQHYETVSMGVGYTLAAWGTFLAFFGSLGVLAAEPGLDPAGQFLRVALLWEDTVLEERVLQEPQTFRIGEDLRNDLVIPAPRLSDKFPLFRARGKGRYDIGLSSDISGEITINQNTQSVADFAKQATDSKGGVDFVPVEPGDWGMIRMDKGLSVFFQFVQPDERVRKAGMLAFDEAVIAAIGLSFIIQIGFLLSSIFLWDESVYRIVQRNQRRPMTVDVVTSMQEEEEEEELEDGEEEDTTAKKAAGEEGKFGDPDEEPEKESKIPQNDGKMVDKIDPKRVGLNDMLSSTNTLTGSGALAEIMNSNSDGFSNKIAIAMAGTGSEFVMGHGAGGMGFKGTGGGGGGEGGYGRIQGMGKIDTGGGRGVNAGLGKKRAKKVGKVRVGSGQTKGFCKKSNIQSVVRRRAGAIRACYEKRLQTKPKLSGKISARWTITAKGTVSGASAGGSLKDGAVVNCVLRVIRRMRFSKPEGGICVIRWPFVFNSGG